MIALKRTDFPAAGFWSLALILSWILCFTIPAEKKKLLKTLSEQLNIPLTIIGTITAGSSIHYYKDDNEVELAMTGFEHFK